MYPNPRYEKIDLSRVEEAGHDTLWLLHIPGTGGGSIRRAMGQLGGKHHIYTHHTAQKMRQVFPEARERQMFAVIRNPRERALKAWAWAKESNTWSPLFGRRPEASIYPLLFKLQGDDPNPFFESVVFQDLIQVCHHFFPQARYLDWPGVELIAFDDLQGGLDRLVERFGGRRIVLGKRHENASGRPPVSVLSEKAAARIDAFYAEDWRVYRGVAGQECPASL